MKHLSVILLIIVGILSSSIEVQAEREYHRRVGTSSYGVDTRKIKCGYCGKEIYASDSHVCYTEKPSSSSHSSSSSYSSEDVTEADVQALRAKYPGLLSNQTSYTPIDYSNTTGNANENSSGEYDNKASEALHTYSGDSKRSSSSWFLNTIIILVVLVAIYVGYKYLRRKKRIPTGQPSAETDEPEPVYVEVEVEDIETQPQSNVTSVEYTHVKDKQPTPPPYYDEPPQSPKVNTSTTLSDTISSIRGKVQDISRKTTQILDKAGNSNTVRNATTRMQKTWDSTRSTVSQKIAQHKLNRQANNISIADELAKYNALRQSGAISNEEFEVLKQRLLNGK